MTACHCSTLHDRHSLLVNALQATIETWMLLEYADRGSLEEAIQNRRFQRKSDKSQLDMVCPLHGPCPA